MSIAAVEQPPAPATDRAPVVTGNLREVMAALRRALPAVPSRPPVPVLAGTLLEATPEGVSFAAFDYELGITAQLARDHVTDVTPGRVLVPAKALDRVLAALRAAADTSDTTLTVDAATRPGFVLVQANGWTVPLPTMPIDEWPGLPTPAGSLALPAATVTGVDMLSALAFVQSAVSRDDTLPILTAVHLMMLGDGRIRLQATDRYRLATCSVEAQVGDLPASMMIRPGTVKALRAALNTGTWRFFHGPATDRLTVVDDTGTAVSSTTVDGSYPKVSELAPSTTTDRILVTVDRRALLRAARTTTFLVDNGCVGPTGGTAILTVLDKSSIGFVPVVTSEGVHGESSPPVQCPPVPASLVSPEHFKVEPGLEIGLNPRYMRDLLDPFTSREVVISVDGGRPSVRPILAAATVEDLVDPTARRHLVMPVRRN